MYEEFYGLNADPFRLSSDHHFCFSHRSYARAKAYVQYALYRAEGFVMVTGRPGTGKTTLINDLLASLPDKEVVAGTLVSTQLEADDLLLMTGHAFGLDLPSQQKALVLQRLMEFLKQQHRQGLRTLLIIDEAQDLAPSALEELRLLTNLQLDGEPLLQIALLGQESLRGLVRSPAMEQVHQRLIAAWQLDPLDPEETIGYVRHRLERAGWRGNPSFEPGVLRIVHGFSQGIPRRINLICSRLMLHGFISERHSLTVEDAVTVAWDLHREELGRPDYKPDEALAHTMEAGNQGMGDGAAAEQASQDSVWSGIDHGLFWMAARKDPEPPAGKVEPRVPEDAEPDAVQSEPRISETRRPAEGGPQPRASAQDEHGAAAPEEPPARPLPAAAAAPGGGHEFQPGPANSKRPNLRSGGSSPVGGGTAGPDAPRAGQTPDSVMHIVPDKAEHWEQTGPLAAGPARRASGERRSGVLWWFLAMAAVSGALIAALLMARTDAMRDSPLTGISPAVKALGQWWSESSATALDALGSLRAGMAPNGAGEAPDADGDAAGVDRPPLATETGPDAGSGGEAAPRDTPADLEPSQDNSATAGAATEAGIEVGSSAGSTAPATISGAGVETEVPSARAVTSPTPEVPAEPPATEMKPDAAAGTVPDSPVSMHPDLPGRSSASRPPEASIESSADPGSPESTAGTSSRSPAPAPSPAPIQDEEPVEPTPLADQPPQGFSEAAPQETTPIRDTVLTTVIGGSAPEASAAPAAIPLSGRVFFRVNSTTVDPQFDALMIEIAEALAQSGDAFAEIVGYTDTTGPPEYNRYLSNQRAEAVAEKLRKRGVPDDRLQIEGQGPREPESGEEGFRAEDRVVEITVLYGSEG